MTLETARNHRPIPILVYHQIAPAPARGAPFRSLYVAPAAFARQMRFLAHLGWRGLSMTALLPFLRGERQGRVLGITFDDGYVNNLEYAAPVLQALGFSATCYAVSGQVGGANVWDEVHGMAQVPLMDAAQMARWCAAGHEIGAHTVHHVHLDQLDGGTARHEIEASGVQLQALLGGMPVSHFCYPYGDFAPAHPAMVAQSGYASATTTARGRVRAGDAMMALPRVPVLRSTTCAHLWLKVATGYEDRRRRHGAA